MTSMHYRSKTDSELAITAAAIIAAVHQPPGRGRPNVFAEASLVARWLKFEDSGEVRTVEDRAALLAQIEEQDAPVFEKVVGCQQRVARAFPLTAEAKPRQQRAFI
jgi:hypothetical protein